MQEITQEPIPTVDAEGIAGEVIRIRYIPLSAARRWDRNPKKHDLGALATSIAKYGFRDPAAYDSALGGFVEGNGRTEALQFMFEQKRPVPRGIGVHPSTGEWYMPVLFGVDAPSRLLAEAYGVDHNNLTLAGGDFTALDYARQWDHSYLQIVQDLAAGGVLPVTVDQEDITTIARAYGADDPAGRGTPVDEGEQRGSMLELAAIVKGPPRHSVTLGDVYQLDRHRLIVGDVVSDWQLWTPYLVGDALFIPYPGPYVVFAEVATNHTLILVQPDPFIAGHILDEFENINGEGSIRVEQEA